MQVDKIQDGRIDMKKRKPRKITLGTRAWQKMADRLARDIAPRIDACKDCGGPVAAG